MSTENPIANEYIIELPQLIDLLPTKNELLTISNTKITSTDIIPEYKTGILKGEENERETDVGWDATTWYSINDNSKINDTISKFTTTNRVTNATSWLCTKKDGFWIRPHVHVQPDDEIAVLMYSISQESFDITYTDQWIGSSLVHPIDSDLWTSDPSDDPGSYNEIFSNSCSCPVLINGQIPHCFKETSARTTLFISMYFENTNWDWLLEKHTADDLLTI